MPMLGMGVLAIWHDIAPEGEREYWRWHNTEHIPERVGVPGFLRGRRFRSVTRPLAYLDFYETESLETIRSAPYLARLNAPTPWTRSVVMHFRDTVRIGCRVLASTGRGQGGVMLTLRLGPAGGRSGDLDAWLTGPVAALGRETAGIVAIHVLETVPETTAIQTEEKRLRGQPEAAAEPRVVLVEMNDVEVASALTAGSLGADSLGARGVAPGAVTGLYRLQVSIDSE